MRLAWATDVHLSFLKPSARHAFFSEVNALDPDWLVLSGDLAEADSLEHFLGELENNVRARTAFVLGNHDYYRGSISGVRHAMRTRSDPAGRSVYLHSLVGPLALGADRAMVGVDGWGDGRCGAPERSDVLLNDWRDIQDFADRGAMFDLPGRLALLHELGDESASRLRSQLDAALGPLRKVLVVTHVPPFPGAAWHEGKPSAPEWSPWFTCQATGEVLLEAARAHPDRELLVLCGHTHGAGELLAAPNLRVLTGEAEYGRAFVRALSF